MLLIFNFQKLTSEMEHTDHMGGAEAGHEKIDSESLKEIGTFVVEGIDVPNYVGHVIPGTIFIILGLKCMYGTFRRYFLCIKEEKSGKTHARKFENSLLFGIAKFPGFPVDSIAVSWDFSVSIHNISRVHSLVVYKDCNIDCVMTNPAENVFQP